MRPEPAFSALHYAHNAVRCRLAGKDSTAAEPKHSTMPTVLRIGRYRFFFYSNEGNEPRHIHVEAGDDEAKFWLLPISLASNHGFRARELNEIEQLVSEHEQAFVEAWNDYFGSG
jgi:hypothetical protein